jgi:hypothetical protein
MKETKQSSVHCMLGQYDYHTKAVGMLTDDDDDNNKQGKPVEIIIFC